MFPVPASAQVSPLPPGLVLPIGTTIRTWESGATDYTTPNSVNLVLAYKGGNFSIDTAYHQTFAQFPANQGVPEIMPTQPLYFVRLYNPTDPNFSSNQVGGWIMRAADVRGLTPQQLRDRFALPAVPTMITYVLVPPNVAPLWTGYAGPIAGWGQGGAQQFYIMSQLHDYRFSNNPRTNLVNTNYTDVENANWDYIPTTSFFHGQLLSAQALSYALPLQGRGNAGKIGAYLDQFVPAAYSDLENVYTTLDFLNFADWGTVPLQNALKQIGPERFSSLGSLGQRNSLLFGDALFQRSQFLRSGLGGGDASGETIGEGLGRLAQLAYVCGFSDPRLVSPNMMPSLATRNGVGLWARGVGEFGNQASGSDFTGFGYRTGGVVGGLDWQPRQDLILGFGAAYLGSDLNWNNNGGTASVSNAKFGLYASYFTPRFFLDGVFTGGVNWTATNRRLAIIDALPSDLVIDRLAAANSTGHDLAAHLQGGVNLPMAGWVLTPLARLSYFDQNQNGFSEQGADDLNLTVQGFSAQTLRSQLGLLAGRTFGLLEVKLRPEVQVGWAHDFPLDNRVINAGLTALGGTFAVNGFKGETDSLLLGAGLTAQLTGGVAVSGRYAAELRRGFQAQMVNLGLRFDF
ncbi:MAG: autotransporter outer membrane beta-barrel domain-containing protein [Desulfobaccales bacterium]